jgi:carboxyl-terminal processing protease
MRESEISVTNPMDAHEWGKLRTAWLIGVMLLAVLSIRLAGPIPKPQDVEFADRIALIREQVRRLYVEPVDESRLDDAAIAGLLQPLDPYTEFFRADVRQRLIESIEGNFVGIGVTIRQNDAGEVEVVSPIEGSPALDAGVEAGDVLISVDGKSLTGLDTEAVSRLVRGRAGTSVRVGLRRLDGSLVEKLIARRQVSVSSIAGMGRTTGVSWNWWADEEARISYVRIRQFTPGVARQVEGVLRELLEEGMRGVILDLRYDGGGVLEEAVDLADLFLDSGTIVGVRARDVPGETRSARASGTLPPIPLAVLVNQDSASASEIFAGAIQDHRRGVVVGVRTFGKGSVQRIIPIGEDGALKITTAYYTLPSGRIIHRRPGDTTWGVEPDIVREMTDDEQRQLIRDWSRREVIRNINGSSIPRPTEASSSESSPAKPSVADVDPQLREAVKALAAMLMKSAPSR